MVCDYCSTASRSHTARIVSATTSYVQRQSLSVQYGSKLLHRPGESIHPSLSLPVNFNGNDILCVT